MFTNYLRYAWRTIRNNKFYSTLNIVGLAFGLTCFFLIGLFLIDELTFDRQHRNVERIYRLVQHVTKPSESFVEAAGGYQIAEQSKVKIRGVVSATRMQRIGRANLMNPANPVNFQEDVTVVDKYFLDIFDFPLIAGNRDKALEQPNSILINETLAKRLFGSTDVLGKSLEFNFLDAPLKITGILKDLPANSSFTFNSLISEATFTNKEFLEYAQKDWLSENYSIFLLLDGTTSPTLVSKGIKQLVDQNFDPLPGTKFDFSIQPLKDMHLNSEGILDGARNSNVEAMPQGSIFYLRVFAFIAIFVLAIAGINYINLTTARANNRLKEIGVRKAVGAIRSHLVRQFLLETMLITMIAFLLSIICVNVMLPGFNAFTKKELSLDAGSDYRIWLLAGGFAALTGLMSGIYPALLLSRFKPVLLLRNFNIRPKSHLSLRKVLVVFQFATSVIMIVGTLVLMLQVRFLNTAELGFDKELLVVVDVNTVKARQYYQQIKTEMEKIPTVKNVSVTSRVPGEWKSYRVVRINKDGGGDKPITTYLFGADQDFLATFGVKMISGRNFKDLNDSGSVMLNETAARLLNITEASGQLVQIPEFSGLKGGSFSLLEKPFRVRVVGIVKDFHFQSLRDKIEPLVLAYAINPIQPVDYYTARVDPSDVPGTLAKLKAILVKVDAEDPFEYHFLDEQIARFYMEDARRQTLLTWICGATVIIACLGLLGLATYSANQRVKEIGIRKVLGASVASVAVLLSKDFLKLVLIANGIAFPIAWWATYKWLQEYAYHIDVQWWVFGAAGTAAVVIALFTVVVQAVKAAVANPVASLRSE